jgi:hypothetical protein
MIYGFNEHFNGDRAGHWAKFFSLELSLLAIYLPNKEKIQVSVTM